MPFVKADGTKLDASGRPIGRLTDAEMDYRDRWNAWVRLPESAKKVTPPPPRHHDPRAGAMQMYLDPDTERRIAERLSGGGGLLDGLRK